DADCLQVGKHMRVEDAAARRRLQRGPATSGQRRRLVDVTRPAFKLRDQVRDRSRLVGARVVPGIKDLQEDPLRPLVIGYVRRGDAAAAVVCKPEPAQLFANGGNVLLGGDARMSPGLD